MTSISKSYMNNDSCKFIFLIIIDRKLSHIKVQWKLEKVINFHFTIGL